MQIINKFKNRTFQNMLFVAFATTIMGQVYINPFNSEFRLHMGIVILTLLLLILDDIPIAETNVITGISIFVFRFSIDYFSSSYQTIDLINKHLPSTIFYMIFGLILTSLNIRKIIDQPIFLIFAITFADIVSNIFEAIIRSEFSIQSLEIVLRSLLITGLTRAILSFLLYISMRFYNILLIKEEQKDKIKELILLKANLKSELFFIRKSMDDIETAMSRSYSIYNELKSKEVRDLTEDYVMTLRERLLNLAKDIHELKKDNQRVVFGLDKLLPEEIDQEGLNLSEILELLRESTYKYISSINKSITFEVTNKGDYYLDDYYPLISILNNLIINSIDSIRYYGHIQVKCLLEDNVLLFTVKDNGTGIKESDIAVIFEPGFSTKFDRKTGKMSTGIGLTHVKELVENHYMGSIGVQSVYDEGTIFSIEIPTDEGEL
ncbi:MAG: sensor histidine kinase [Acidaminobacteraceae bacterium]